MNRLTFITEQIASGRTQLSKKNKQSGNAITEERLEKE